MICSRLSKILLVATTRRQGKSDNKTRSYTNIRFNVNSPIEQSNQTLCYGESKPGSSGFSSVFVIQLPETVEDTICLAGRNTNPCVGHPKNKLVIVAKYVEFDDSRIGEFHSIATISS